MGLALSPGSAAALSDVRTVHGALAVACAWLSRIAAFVVLLYYAVLDAIGGSPAASSATRIEVPQPFVFAAFLHRARDGG
ncbi:hypothetical protein [Nannocystis pusilla]|uniref:hypothetical protein n=1 Tax=Nannocystis pusilla TaxID=889268 RepID=UPI003B816646